MQTQCSCGEAEPHIVAKRQTADGIGVRLWSDGMVTGSLGGRLPGIPAGRPRTTEGLRVALRAGWELMGWVSLYDTAEIGDLYAECRKAAQAGVSLVDWRRSSAEAPSTTLRPTWEVYQADRDGRPKVRVWRLPRILFGTGLAVWDHCTGGRGGRYELVSVKRVLGGDDIAETTGLRFATLAALEAHLRSP